MYKDSYIEVRAALKRPILDKGQEIALKNGIYLIFFLLILIIFLYLHPSLGNLSNCIITKTL